MRYERRRGEESRARERERESKRGIGRETGEREGQLYIRLQGATLSRLTSLTARSGGLLSPLTTNHIRICVWVWVCVCLGVCVCVRATLRWLCGWALFMSDDTTWDESISASAQASSLSWPAALSCFPHPAHLHLLPWCIHFNFCFVYNLRDTTSIKCLAGKAHTCSWKKHP